MNAAIAVHDLRKSFGDHRVLGGVTFSVAPGEIFALLGPNGAGKTTTINVLTTLASADSGSVRVGGFDPRTNPRDVQRRISLTGQSAAVDARLTGRENLEMFGELAGLSKAEAKRQATALLSEFDLADAADKRVSTYSGGMRRRLDLALSFVTKPEILFLDEPTTGLDTRSRRDLWQRIRRAASDGTTVFLTTQYLEEADQLADRIAVLNNGTIAAIGAPAALKAAVGSDAIEIADAAGTVIASLATDGSLESVRSALDSLHASGLSGTVSVRQPTLDDVFLALTGEPTAGSTKETVK